MIATPRTVSPSTLPWPGGAALALSTPGPRRLGPACRLTPARCWPRSWSTADPDPARLHRGRDRRPHRGCGSPSMLAPTDRQPIPQGPGVAGDGGPALGRGQRGRGHRVGVRCGTTWPGRTRVLVACAYPLSSVSRTIGGDLAAISQVWATIPGYCIAARQLRRLSPERPADRPGGATAPKSVRARRVRRAGGPTVRGGGALGAVGSGAGRTSSTGWGLSLGSCRKLATNRAQASPGRAVRGAGPRRRDSRSNPTAVSRCQSIVSILGAVDADARGVHQGAGGTRGGRPAVIGLGHDPHTPGGKVGVVRARPVPPPRPRRRPPRAAVRAPGLARPRSGAGRPRDVPAPAAAAAAAPASAWAP